MKREKAYENYTTHLSASMKAMWYECIMPYNASIDRKARGFVNMK